MVNGIDIYIFNHIEKPTVWTAVLFYKTVFLEKHVLKHEPASLCWWRHDVRNSHLFQLDAMNFRKARCRLWFLWGINIKLPHVAIEFGVRQFGVINLQDISAASLRNSLHSFAYLCLWHMVSLHFLVKQDTVRKLMACLFQSSLIIVIVWTSIKGIDDVVFFLAHSMHKVCHTKAGFAPVIFTSRWCIVMWSHGRIILMTPITQYHLGLFHECVLSDILTKLYMSN